MRSRHPDLRLLTCCALLCLLNLHLEASEKLIGRLDSTQSVNIDAVIDGQFKLAAPANGFRVTDPYGPGASDAVQAWFDGAGKAMEVCAMRFVDEQRQRYELRKFDSAEAAAKAGFTVTHQGRCGSCSTLRDLSVYLATPDLTTPARRCARRRGLEGKFQCYSEEIGFTPYCAESWAYNARHTRQECLGACIADYGLLNLLLHRYPGPNVDETGRLRPCLQCDEDRSGPGFKYSAGRTRRNSGIVSAISRPETEIYRVDHSIYFR